MKATSVTPILNVSSVPASFAWFEGLGWKRGFAWNDGGMIVGAADSNTHGPATFGSVCAGTEGEEEVQIFLCQGAQGLRGGKAPYPGCDDDVGAMWMSIWLPSLADVDAAYELAKAKGVTVVAPPVNEPWGVRECRIMHPDGHVFRLSAHH
jgi:hypothetical protein